MCGWRMQMITLYARWSTAHAPDVLHDAAYGHWIPQHQLMMPYAASRLREDFNFDTCERRLTCLTRSQLPLHEQADPDHPVFAVLKGVKGCDQASCMHASMVAVFFNVQQAYTTGCLQMQTCSHCPLHADTACHHATLLVHHIIVACMFHGAGRAAGLLPLADRLVPEVPGCCYQCGGNDWRELEGPECTVFLKSRTATTRFVDLMCTNCSAGASQQPTCIIVDGPEFGLLRQTPSQACELHIEQAATMMTS